MGSGGGHRNLLPEHRAHREFEGIPAPGDASARFVRNGRREQRIGPEPIRYGLHGRIEIEQAPATTNELRHGERAATFDLHEHAVGYESVGRRSGTVVTAPGTAIGRLAVDLLKVLDGAHDASAKKVREGLV